MRTLKLVIEYDGTGYCGWQRQRGAAPGTPRSVQGTLESAVAAVTGETVPVVGAGRTDAGVHALGQVAHLETSSRLSAGRFPGALNANLPPDIRVLAAEEAPPGFHARYDAVSRTYRYEILNRAVPSALLRHRAYHVSDPLDVDAMHRALVSLLGRHDFAAYHGAGSSPRTTVCTVTAARCVRRGTRIHLTISADRFLRHMVRIMAGTLVRVGAGRLPEDAPAAFLEAAGNGGPGPKVPAHGLFLVRVDYREPEGGKHAGG